MYCAKCGAFLADDARVCSSCGKPVRIRPAAGIPAGEKTDRADRHSRGTETRKDDIGRQIMDDEKIMDPVYFEDAAGNPDVESIIRMARGEAIQEPEDWIPEEELASPESGEDREKSSLNSSTAGSSDHSGTRRETASESRSRTVRTPLTAEERKEAEAARKRQEAALKRRQASAAKRKKAAASNKRKAAAARQERPVYSDRNTRPAVIRDPKKPSMFDGIRRSMKEYAHAREEAADERQMRKHMANAARYYDSMEMSGEWTEREPGGRTGYAQADTYDTAISREEDFGEDFAAAEFGPEAAGTARKTAPVTVPAAAEPTERAAAKVVETVKETVPAAAESIEQTAKAEEAVEKTSPAKAVETVDKSSYAAAQPAERAPMTAAGEIVEKGSYAAAQPAERAAKLEEPVQKSAPAETPASEYGVKEDHTADTAAAGKMYISAAAVEELRARLKEELRPGLVEELRPGLEEEIRAGLEEKLRPGLEKEIRAGLEEEIRSRLEKEYAARAEAGAVSKGDSLSDILDRYDGLFSEEELRIEAARRLRRYNDAEQQEVNAAFGLFGLNRAMSVRLATFFLIVVLSVIYVIGRGNNPEDHQSAPSGNMSEDTASPDKEAGTQKKESADDSVPTGGGEFGGGEASEEE